MKKTLKFFLIFLLICSVLTSFISCGTKVAGKYTLRWVTTDYGTIYDTPDLCIELRKDRTFTYGETEGKWKAKGDEITLTYESGDSVTLYYDDEYLTQTFYDSSLGFYKYTFGKEK